MSNSWCLMLHDDRRINLRNNNLFCNCSSQRSILGASFLDLISRFSTKFAVLLKLFIEFPHIALLIATTPVSLKRQNCKRNRVVVTATICATGLRQNKFSVTYYYSAYKLCVDKNVHKFFGLKLEQFIYICVVSGKEYEGK